MHTQSSAKDSVSVIIPCYNYAQYLPRAIESALEQARASLEVEVIVVDDGSTDATASVAKEYGTRIRYIYQENKGLSGARNTGIREAKKDFVLFLDADDLLAKNNLEKQLLNFKRNPSLDISVCLSVLTDDPFARPLQGSLFPLKAKHLDLHLCNSNIAPVHSFLVRRHVLERCGFFDETLPACEDQDYWRRCAVAGCTFAATTETSTYYLQHEDSLSRRLGQQLESDTKMNFLISKALDECPDFPRAGKYYGWLAHAAGLLDSALFNEAVELEACKKLAQEGGFSLMRALSEPRLIEEEYLSYCEEYYITKIVVILRNLKNRPPLLQKAIKLLFAERKPFLKAKDDVLEHKIEVLNKKICCELPTNLAMIL